MFLVQGGSHIFRNLLGRSIAGIFGISGGVKHFRRNATLRDAMIICNMYLIISIDNETTLLYDMIILLMLLK